MTTNKNRILILSDSEELIESLSLDLELLGYTPFSMSIIKSDTSQILRMDPDILFFDFTDWDESVLQIYQGLKNNARLENLAAGYVGIVSENSITKLPVTMEFEEMILLPVKVKELDFRVKRLLWQKGQVADHEIIKINDLIMHLARYEVWVRGEQLELTFKEFELLKYLATHRGRAFNRETLLNVIWGYDYYGGTRTVDVHIRRIRAKINDIDESYIKTIRGVGYMFQD